MRYRGQGHEIAVPLPVGRLDPAALRAAFDQTYGRLYGRTIPRLEVEAVTWTLSLSEPYDLPTRLPRPPDPAPIAPGATCRLIETTSGDSVDAGLFERASLPVGACMSGPCVIVEAGTSTIVPAGYNARIGAAGEIVIEDIAT
jgi:N-methylhydantoinase A